MAVCASILFDSLRHLAPRPDPVHLTIEDSIRVSGIKDKESSSSSGVG